jgi:MFS transporter, DHA1 family, inner membrane transport protein
MSRKLATAIGGRGTPLQASAGSFQSGASVAGAMLVGTAALMILGVQPILLGALAEAGRLSVSGLGRLAMAEVMALALGSAIGTRVMPHGRIRAKTTLACLVLAIADFAIYLPHSTAELYALRVIAGLAEGLALGATVAILTHTRHPARVNGLFLGLQTLPQMLAAYLLPVWIIPTWGVNAGFGLLGVLALLSITGTYWLQWFLPVIEATNTRWHRSPSVLTALGAVIVQNAAIGGAWNYIEQVATDRQLGASTIGTALSASLAFQVVGALLVAWIGWRAPYRIVLWAAISVQTGIALLLSQAPSASAYVVEASAFGLLWLALQPFQIRQLIALDPTRSAVLLVTPLTLVGLSLGPFCVSFAVKTQDVSGAYWLAAILFLLSAVLFEAATRLGRKSAS